jgi:hypothetical protein
LTPDAVVFLVAAHTGCNPDSFKGVDGDFGRLPGEIPNDDVGKGSFADILRQKLSQRLPDVAVWAHASRFEPASTEHLYSPRDYDAVRNPDLRVFTRSGSVDLLWLPGNLYGSKDNPEGKHPTSKENAAKERVAWTSRFYPAGTRQMPSNVRPWAALGAGLQNPTKVVGEWFRK